MRLLSAFLFIFIQVCNAQQHGSLTSRSDEQLIWCTTSEPEQRKCQAWAAAVGDVILRAQLNGNRSPFEFTLKCERFPDKDQCMNQIANGYVDLLTLDAGEVFIAGRYHSLVPIMSEVYGSLMGGGYSSLRSSSQSMSYTPVMPYVPASEPPERSGYYAVAVVHKSGRIQNPADLAGAQACFSSVGQMAGWVLPLAGLLQRGLMPVADCNNMIKTAAKFFNSSCAPGSLIDKHNPSGDNPQSMCSLCSSTCTGSERYAGFFGAFQCLVQRGEVAFIKHSTVQLAMDRGLLGSLLPMGNTMSGTVMGSSSRSKHDFALLCPEGGRAELHAYATCNWGYVPAHAVVTLSSVLPERRVKMQRFLSTSAMVFSGQGLPNMGASMPPIDSYAYGRPSSGYIHIGENTPTINSSFSLFGDGFNLDPSAGDLIFSADATGLRPIDPSAQTFKGYLNSQVSVFEQIRQCPVPAARLCVTSDAEAKKCSSMATAFRAQMLKPALTCVLRNSSIQCMQAISSGTADLTMLDAADIYRGGLAYGLAPIVSERYNLDDSSFYAVAVSRQSDKESDLLQLKGRRACHTSYGSADGWIIPLHFLLSNNRMRGYECDSLRAASQFFQKSCAPGALSPSYARDAWSFGVLCDLCHGSSYRFCARNHLEPFFGTSGALRCLVEGGGEVAFVRHTTILENTAGRNPMLWSRNMIPDDFELLCRDGTRAKYNEYQKCHLGRVPANALVTSGERHPDQINAYVNLFLLAQELYGSKYSQDYTFKMFVSQAERGIADLIFQDATSSLLTVPEHRRHYLAYLGPTFVHAFKSVDCAWSSTSSLTITPIFLVICWVISFGIRNYL